LQIQVAGTPRYDVQNHLFEEFVACVGVAVDAVLFFVLHQPGCVKLAAGVPAGLLLVFVLLLPLCFVR
jgi:hypothetical protein